MSNEFYVGIREPKSLRRSLLTSSKNILEVLKKSQEIITLRKEKLFVMDVLGQELSELRLLLEKLDEKLPEELLDNAPVKPIIASKHEKEKKLPEIQIDSEPLNALAELERIEKALAGVEDKLKYLD